MGIYIKNMEMPKSCIACLLNFGEKRPEYGLTICCPYSDGVISWRDMAFDNGRLASCGIVPVPPHGRLIDADEFLKRAIGTKCFRGDYALMLEELVGESTTIIPAEEGET